jgi:putative restriction endonuclease
MGPQSAAYWSKSARIPSGSARMKAWLAVTDGTWFRYLRERPGIDEVDFWQPGGTREFRILSVGQPLLFKLHYPDHFVVGGGFFRHAPRLPVSLAWETFEDKPSIPRVARGRRIQGMTSGAIRSTARDPARHCMA